MLCCTSLGGSVSYTEQPGMNQYGTSMYWCFGMSSLAVRGSSEQMQPSGSRNTVILFFEWVERSVCSCDCPRSCHPPPCPPESSWVGTAGAGAAPVAVWMQLHGHGSTQGRAGPTPSHSEEHPCSHQDVSSSIQPSARAGKPSRVCALLKSYSN